MENIKYKVQEYSLKNVKDCVVRYRREKNYVGPLLISVPIEAEHSLGFLKNSYPSDVQFRVSLEIGEKDLLISNA